MSEGTKLRVQVEFGDVKANFEGDADEVFKALSRFLTQLFPNLETIQRLVYTPDLIKLSERLAGLVELTPEGPIIVSVDIASASEMIRLALLGAHLGYRLGKLGKDTLSSNEIARITGKAKKTIMNEMPELVNKGYVEKTSEGEYSITILGIKQTEKIIEDYKVEMKK